MKIMTKLKLLFILLVNFSFLNLLIGGEDPISNSAELEYNSLSNPTEINFFKPRGSFKEARDICDLTLSTNYDYAIKMLLDNDANLHIFIENKIFSSNNKVKKCLFKDKNANMKQIFDEYDRRLSNGSYSSYFYRKDVITLIGDHESIEIKYLSNLSSDVNDRSRWITETVLGINGIVGVKCNYI